MDNPPTHILVVDDDENTRRLFEAALKSRGYEVELAGDGVEGLDRIRSHAFDVLVSDLNMPRMDGQAMIEIAHSLQPQMGLIMVTGFRTHESVLATFRHGLHAYLEKPVNLEDLFHAVESSLRAREEIGAGEGVVIESPGEGWIRFSAPSHHTFVWRFENLFRMLFDDGVPAEILDDLRIAITELGGNAVEWGNRSDMSKPLQISAKRSRDRIVIIFEDEGSGFDLEGVPDPTLDPIGVLMDRRAQGKRPGGYGIALVKRLVDGLVYNSQGNLVMIVKKLTPKEKSSPSDS